MTGVREQKLSQKVFTGVLIMCGFGSGLIHPVLERPHTIYPIKTRIKYGCWRGKKKKIDYVPSGPRKITKVPMRLDPRSEGAWGDGQPA